MTGVRTISDPRSDAVARVAWLPYAALAAGVVALLLLFQREATDAVLVWLGSTAYNHCFLVVPIVIYLIWDRRADLAGFVPHPAPVFALLALPLTIGWFVAERIGFMEGRQLVAMTGMELLFLSVLGLGGFWRLSGPLLYLYFLVPFGGFLTPALQQFTTWFVMHGLDLLGIANFTDGVTIQIPEGTFVIATACAGLRFLIAAIAFGCLYALVIYRSPLRRGVFIAVSLVVPVIANGFRALGIVVLGHLLGSAQAAETDHVLYGWMFFSIVLLILIVLGLPFREDTRKGGPERRRQVALPLIPPPPGRTMAAALGCVVLLCVGPAIAETLDAFVGQPAGVLRLAAQPPCRAVDPLARPSAGAGWDRLAATGYRCAGVNLTVQSEVFPARAAPRPILKALEEVGGVQGETVEHGTTLANGVRWRITRSADPFAIQASLLWADGHIVDGGMRFRLRRAWQSIAGGGSPVVLLVVSPEMPVLATGIAGQRQQQAALATFLTTQTGIPPALAAVSPTRR